ncbi:MAG TPA: hypothetical protein VK020_14365 [Microlunatus sp.]|nr:hypothetical protein [Microlunatus sp.]
MKHGQRIAVALTALAALGLLGTSGASAEPADPAPEGRAVLRPVEHHRPAERGAKVTLRCPAGAERPPAKADLDRLEPRQKVRLGRSAAIRCKIAAVAPRR